MVPPPSAAPPALPSPLGLLLLPPLPFCLWEAAPLPVAAAARCLLVAARVACAALVAARAAAALVTATAAAAAEAATAALDDASAALCSSSSELTSWTRSQ